MEISVKIITDENIFVSYPSYNDEWNIIANPDGTIYNLSDGLEYSYLFWEAKDTYEYDMSTGFVIKGEDTEKFLKEKLSYLGLTPTEYNEFIVYWLPKMIENEYNLITFQFDDYTSRYEYNINPEPDSILRVFMIFKALKSYIEIEAQELNTFERTGFTVIEWGGTEIID